MSTGAQLAKAVVAPWVMTDLLVRPLAICLWIAGSLATAQTLKFEVATVKPADPNDTISVTAPSMSGRRFEFRNVTLRVMAYWAYGSGLSTAMSISGGPDWMNRTHYTVEAEAESSSSEPEYRAMLRSLLEERFSLKTHNETRQIDVYALLPDRPDGKLGPNVKPWSGACASGRAPRPAGDPAMPRCMGGFLPPGLVLEGVTMIPVAEMLSTRRPLLGMIVQDRTGLTGPYNIRLEFDFNAANQPDYAGPSIFTALKEQLGLKLTGSKGMLQVLVVDGATTPGDN